MNKSKIITFPPSDEKRRVLLINNELIKITPHSEDSLIIDIAYEGTLTPEWLDEEEEIIGYSNWVGSEYGVHGTIDPLDENILHLCYYENDSIIVVGYHLTKIKIGEQEFDDYLQAVDGEGNEETVFSNIGGISPFEENIPVDVILYF